MVLGRESQFGHYENKILTRVKMSIIEIGFVRNLS